MNRLTTEQKKDEIDLRSRRESHTLRGIYFSFVDSIDSFGVIIQVKMPVWIDDEYKKKSSQEFHSFIPRWVEKKSSSGESSWKYAHTQTQTESNQTDVIWHWPKRVHFFLCMARPQVELVCVVVVPCSLTKESQQTVFAEQSNDSILSANTSTECGWRQGQSKRVVFIWFSNE